MLSPTSALFTPPKTYTIAPRLAPRGHLRHTLAPWIPYRQTRTHPLPATHPDTPNPGHNNLVAQAPTTTQYTPLPPPAFPYIRCHLHLESCDNCNLPLP